LATGAFAFVFGEAWQINWTTTFAITLTWQVISLSIGTVVLLMYMLIKDEGGRVSSRFYLAPPMVVVEAPFLFSETLGSVSIAGMLLCIAGIHIINRALRR
jgi:drug/metabolite transporter (DMT)-like permease